MNNRLKNPYFWIGLGGIFLTAMGVSPEMFTDWSTVATAAKEFISNPFLIGTVAMSILGVFVNPTTKGLKDQEDPDELP